jgi:serine/threonine protein phosphatase 1
MRRFLIGDIHGNYKALKQCLERSEFDYDNDTLIQLGDVVDGYSEVYECVEELLKIRNLLVCRGNHDDWFITWLQSGIHPDRWKQGGLATAKSYLRQIDKEHLITPTMVGLNPDDVPPLHQKFFRDMNKYIRDEDRNIFVHAGFNHHRLLKEQEDYIFWWDRDLFMSAMSFEATKRGLVYRDLEFNIEEPCKEIFIGHTSTLLWKKTEPIHAANIWNLDTGAGSHGKLTIMDVETKQYYQSDLASLLYPNEKGR